MVLETPDLTGQFAHLFGQVILLSLQVGNLFVPALDLSLGRGRRLCCLGGSAGQFSGGSDPLVGDRVQIFDALAEIGFEGGIHPHLLGELARRGHQIVGQGRLLTLHVDPCLFSFLRVQKPSGAEAQADKHQHRGNEFGFH